MTVRPVVGIDLDDVLADFIRTFMRMGAEKFGVDESLRPTSWEWDNTQLTLEMQNELWKDIRETFNFWETLHPIQGVKAGLLQQLDRHAQLFFPTARAESKGDNTGRQSARWLHRMYGIQYPTVIVSPNKAEMARALKYDYFIDDRPKNVIEVQGVLPNCKIYLQDATHNQTFDNAALGIPRLHSFNDFATIVLEDIHAANMKYGVKEEVAA